MESPAGSRHRPRGQERGKAMYELISTTGGGELVELLKEATKTKDFSTVEIRIRETITPFLYNEGKGKIVHISDIVLARCEEKGIVLR